MIPLIDDFLQVFLVKKLKWIKENPKVIDLIFQTGRRETLNKLKEFITNSKVKVIIGYPREQSSLPCYVITLAPEHEQPIGLGDDSDTFENYDIDTESTNEELVNEATKAMSQYLANTYMNSNYRIECWSDNGDLTAYMYVILKWCMWGSRQEMLNLGWVNITLSGTDLEPVPDYMPAFIYRRSIQINLMYENIYFDNLAIIGDYIKVIDKPDDYHIDKNDNIVDKEDNVVIPANMTWILSAHYYDESTGKEYLNKVFKVDKTQ